jgi:hypothetical protein
VQAGCCAALALGGGALAGCGGSADVAIRSYKDPYFPEKLRVRFENGSYWRAADLDIHAISERETIDEMTDEVTRQYLYVVLYWRPNPGRSFDDPTQSNALYRYVVATSSGVATYVGTGFAYPEGQAGRPLDIALESAALRLESTSRDLPDVLGELELTGTLRANPNSNEAAIRIRSLERTAQRGFLKTAAPHVAQNR